MATKKERVEIKAPKMITAIFKIDCLSAYFKFNKGEQWNSF